MTSAGQPWHDTASWEIGKVVDPSTGLLGRADFPTDAPWVPLDLRIDGEHLCWRMWDPENRERRAREAANTAEMLGQFVRLNDANGVLRFAQRFGVLGICEHGLPWTHNPPPTFLSSDSSRGCRPIGWPEVREPVARWIQFAGQARAALNLAAALHQDKPGAVEDWRTIYADRQSEDWFEAMVKAAQDMPHYALGLLVDEWLTIGHVRGGFFWPEREGPRFTLQAGAFGHLALQLAMAIGHTQALTICSGCGAAYLRQGRRPARGRRNFCSECHQTGEPERIRKAASRARKRRGF